MFTQRYSIDMLREMGFGMLHVVNEVEPKVYVYDGRTKKARMMECECDCGKKGVVVSLNNLVRGHTCSCGCYKDRYAKQFLKNYKGDRVYKIS